MVLVNVLLSGCVTYQIAKYVEGDEVVVSKEELEVHSLYSVPQTR
jgi:hypothetical protein